MDVCKSEEDKGSVSASECCVMVGTCSKAVTLVQTEKKDEHEEQTAVPAG